jgi:hypothetical protein
MTISLPTSTRISTPTSTTTLDVPLTLWILGASDPEMNAIEKLLAECGQTFGFAVDNQGKLVHPGNAYEAAGVFLGGDLTAGTRVLLAAPRVVLVECGGPALKRLEDSWEVIRCDHHRSGDPGYRVTPDKFLPASSIGQVISRLARDGLLPPSWPRETTFFVDHGTFQLTPDGWAVGYPPHKVVHIPENLVMVAAADHCLGAAYAGLCPGIDPVALGRVRAADRASFQGRPVEDVYADIEATTEALRDAPRIRLESSEGTIQIADMRRAVPWPELPEAGTRLGVAYISGPLTTTDGRQKFVVSGSVAEVSAWMTWAPANGIVDLYGDPVRGFAGGYQRVPEGTP